MRVLFLCSRNRLRSPTAEETFRGRAGWEVASAGLAPDADEKLSQETLDWADIIFVMESAHRRKLVQKFGAHLRNKRIICLDVSDDYEFLQPELVALLTQRINAIFPP
ncbi:MAG TPA: hypothetical protein VM821_05440 [Abditibacteriaceae bacterium]|nr:hypothetical protein [Abditibacteriaceae bacterium]